MPACASIRPAVSATCRRRPAPPPRPPSARRRSPGPARPGPCRTAARCPATRCRRARRQRVARRHRQGDIGVAAELDVGIEDVDPAQRAVLPSASPPARHRQLALAITGPAARARVWRAPSYTVATISLSTTAVGADHQPARVPAHRVAGLAPRARRQHRFRKRRVAFAPAAVQVLVASVQARVDPVRRRAGGFGVRPRRAASSG